MSLKNTARDYGSIAKWLHWMTAALFLAAYVSVYYRQWFTEKQTPENMTALQMHLSVGVSIAVIVALRVIWRLMNRAPDDEPGSALAHRAAHLGHLALYAVMIVAPLTGYLGTGVDTRYFFLFDIPKFESTALFQSVVVDGFGLDFKTFEKPIDFIHKDVLGARLIWLLVLGHVAAALYHHFVRRDRTLLKMTSGR
ncbi:cytochrome b [Methyloversatilis thermotolerans]|uniref:cytochrome b n=1 Tax=Methyloversatilis thermotolerans TaxID=1346290 RepID=UPI000378C4B0|nr:cytochrome b [Methyloversatilis thermotolerans]